MEDKYSIMIIDAVTNEIVEYYEFDKTNRCNTTT